MQIKHSAITKVTTLIKSLSIRKEFIIKEQIIVTPKDITPLIKAVLENRTCKYCFFPAGQK